MKTRQTTHLFFCLFILFSLDAFSQKKTVARKQMITFDVGLGSIDQFEKIARGDSYNWPTINIYEFNPKLSIQPTIGYSNKLDFLQFDWKVGYSQMGYYIKSQLVNSGKAPSPSVSDSGTVMINSAFVQLLGVNFAKEYSVGTFFIGGFARYRFWEDYQKNGMRIIEGSTWNNGPGYVYEELPMAALIDYNKFYFGVQTGFSFKINQQSEILAKVELTNLKFNSESQSAYQYLFSLGYVYVFKIDRILDPK